MKKRGIQIDLSAYFKDMRKMVYVMVDPNWECVERLQNRVEYLFDIDSVRFLNSAGNYLSPRESIEIIKFCEGLIAFVADETLETRKKTKSKKSKFLQKSPNVSESDEKLTNIDRIQENDGVIKKRKYSVESIHGAGTAPNHAKRLKGSNEITENLAPVQHDNKCMEITSTSEQVQPSTVLNKHKFAISKNTKAKHLKNCESIDTESDHQSSAIIEQNAKSSEKKRELILEKETDNAEEKTLISTKLSARSTSIPSSTFLNESKIIVQNHTKKSTINSSKSNNLLRKQLSSKGHIYFDEGGEVVSTTNKSQSKAAKEAKTMVMFRCPLQEITNKEGTPKPRIFNIKLQSSYNKKKELIQICENIVLAPIPNQDFENHNSLVEKNSAKKSQIKEIPANNSEHEQNNTKISEIDILKEKTNRSDKIDITENTMITKNIDIPLHNSIDKSLVENNLKEVVNEQNSTSELQSTNINQSSIASIDCVDLSMESQEDNDVIKTNFKTNKKPVISNADDSSSDVEEISEVIDLNETEDNCSTPFFKDSSVYPGSLNDLKIDQILPFCTNMSDLPSVNDIIVFKMACVNKKLKSEETNFIAGKVEYINKRTKSIKLLILDGLSEMCYIDSKFILNVIDSDDVIEYLHFKMSDTIEPKILSKC